MNEQVPNTANTGEGLRTIAIRVNPELRGQFDAVLEITGMSVNTAGTEALEGWIAGKLSDPELQEKAVAQLDEEERAIKARREALQGLIGEGAVALEQQKGGRRTPKA